MVLFDEACTLSSRVIGLIGFAEAESEMLNANFSPVRRAVLRQSTGESWRSNTSPSTEKAGRHKIEILKVDIAHRAVIAWLR